MEKVDWHKPLRLTKEVNPAGRGSDPVTTFNSHGSRVVWVGDRVYPVDAEGYAAADVRYPGRRGVIMGTKIVENVPEEPKDHLHLYHDGGTWCIDDPDQLRSKSEWEEIRQTTSRVFPKGLVVKVPA